MHVLLQISWKSRSRTACLEPGRRDKMNIHTVNDGPIEELLDEADPRTTSWNEFGVDERDVIGVLKAERGRYGSVAVTLIGRTVPRLLWTSTEDHVARVAVR